MLRIASLSFVQCLHVCTTSEFSFLFDTCVPIQYNPCMVTALLSRFTVYGGTVPGVATTDHSFRSHDTVHATD